jgi:hypothetical protein
MATCPRCSGGVEPSFRFCPWCSEPQRRKLVEFFRPHDRDRGRALRVSRYYGDEPHVRFSVWYADGTAHAAVSLDDDEAERLARFVLASRVRRGRARLAALLRERSA